MTRPVPRVIVRILTRCEDCGHPIVARSETATADAQRDHLGWHRDAAIMTLAASL